MYYTTNKSLYRLPLLYWTLSFNHNDVFQNAFTTDFSLIYFVLLNFAHTYSILNNFEDKTALSSLKSFLIGNPWSFEGTLVGQPNYVSWIVNYEGNKKMIWNSSLYLSGNVTDHRRGNAEQYTVYFNAAHTRGTHGNIYSPEMISNTGQVRERGEY